MVPKSVIGMRVGSQPRVESRCFANNQIFKISF